MLNLARFPLLKTEPWEHQRIGGRLIEDQPGTLLAHDMGTGKTKTTIDAIVNLDCRRVLILCPCAVLDVWPSEFEKHAAFLPSELEVVLLTGPIAKRAERITRISRAPRTVFVTNYEALVSKAFVAAATQPWDMLVCDECHRVKAPGGVHSWAVTRIAKQAKRRVGLSGTPMTDRPMDAYAQFRFLDQRVFGKSFARHRNRYAIMGGFQGRQIVSYQNQDEFKMLFHSITHVVRKRDVLDLPPVIHETRAVPLEPKAMQTYIEIEADFWAWVDEVGEVSAANALVKMLRLQQITSGFLRTETGVSVSIGSAKRKELENVFESLAPDEPVVVFCRFRHDLMAIREAADNAGRECAELSGTANELTEWKQSTGPTVLAVQIQSGSLGIDLTRAAYCVFYSTGFSLGEYEQALARVDRPGQTRSVTYIHLLATGTIDVKVHKAFRDKKNVIEEILKARNDDERVKALAHT